MTIVQLYSYQLNAAHLCVHCSLVMLLLLVYVKAHRPHSSSLSTELYLMAYNPRQTANNIIGAVSVNSQTTQLPELLRDSK